MAMHIHKTTSTRTTSENEEHESHGERSSIRRAPEGAAPVQVEGALGDTRYADLVGATLVQVALDGERLDAGRMTYDQWRTRRMDADQFLERLELTARVVVGEL